MEIQFSKENSDFIKMTYGCKDVDSTSIPNGINCIYFQPTVFIQKAENYGTTIFEQKHLSQLPKEDVLEILRHIITKSL